jgi:hypothetical protein
MGRFLAEDTHYILWDISLVDFVQLSSVAFTLLFLPWTFASQEILALCL